MLKRFYKQENPNGKGSLLFQSFMSTYICKAYKCFPLMFIFKHLVFLSAPKCKVRKV